MTKVLIVDDSIVSRQLLKYIFYLSGDISVVAEAKDGNEAIRIMNDRKVQRPDIITMDIEMPGIDGYETTKIILEQHAIPVVIISNTLQYYSAEKAFRAMQAGAVAAVGKPPGLGSPDFYKHARELIDLVKRSAAIDIKRRISAKYRPQATEEVYPPIEKKYAQQTAEEIGNWIQTNQPAVIAIGASTGGPPAIQSILVRLPADFRMPIVIVQHIASGLAKNFAEWLDKTCPIHCKLAEDGEKLKPETVYIAPNDIHTTVIWPDMLHFRLPGPQEIIVPSAEMLFHSVAEQYGTHAIGILLTGMGRDGSRGLLELKNAGALTIAQDRESSVVYGMPGEAEKLGAACCYLPPESIAKILLEIYNAALKEKEQTR